MSAEKWIVGAEYDQALFLSLGRCLSELGYAAENKSWGVGGSQEISEWVVTGPKGTLFIESETYIGLSVSGPTELVLQMRQYFGSKVF